MDKIPLLIDFWGFVFVWFSPPHCLPFLLYLLHLPSYPVILPLLFLSTPPGLNKACVVMLWLHFTLPGFWSSFTQQVLWQKKKKKSLYFTCLTVPTFPPNLFIWRTAFHNTSQWFEICSRWKKWWSRMSESILYSAVWTVMLVMTFSALSLSQQQVVR